MHVLHQLAKEFQECRRLMGRLLDQLRDECGFPQAVSNHRAHHRAMDLLVRERIVRELHCYNYISRLFDTDTGISCVYRISPIRSYIVVAMMAGPSRTIAAMRGLTALRLPQCTPTRSMPQETARCAVLQHS
jgi:hypothetical protein